MESNGGDTVMVSESEATVEIKIKTLDSQTYTLRVDKCVPVPTLKDKIATVTGVLSEQQRLICRGKVLMDDQLLSAYHVEDGHTLHLVVRQPIPPSIDGDVSANDPASSSGYRMNQSGSSVVLGTFNISESNEGAFPDINRIVSAVLGSFGVSGGEGPDLNEAAPEGIFRAIRVSSRNYGGRQTDQTATSGSSNPGTGNSSFSASAPLDPLELPIIPDALTTLALFMTRVRNDFSSNVRELANNSQPGDNLGDFDAGLRSPSGGLPTPASLAEVIMSARQLLVHQLANSLSQLAGQLQNQANVTDALARMTTQSNALRTGLLLQHLGAFLLELGRTTMTLRMGMTPNEAVVNAGPAMFISTSGPNPIMVQPLPYQHGASFGTTPGTGQHGTGLPGEFIGSGFSPRNIDIRIRTGSSSPSASTASQGEAAGIQQSPGQNNQSTPDIGSFVNLNVPAASGNLPSMMESEIRRMPIRTVVAALPASVDRPRIPVGSFIPVVARVQRVSSGNFRSQRGSQSSDGGRSGSGQQPSSNFTVPQDGTRLPGENADVPAGDGAQNNQDFPANIPRSFGQLLRSIFSGEHIHTSDVNFQDSATGDLRPNHSGAATVDTTSTQESVPPVSDGVFLSNILRQIMPIISENTTGGSAAGSDDAENRDAQTSSTQGQANTEREGRSGRRGNPPSSPSSKRPRRQ